MASRRLLWAGLGAFPIGLAINDHLVSFVVTEPCDTHTRQLLIYRKRVPAFSEGDMVVFPNPYNPVELQVSRVFATVGDIVRTDEGRVKVVVSSPQFSIFISLFSRFPVARFG